MTTEEKAKAYDEAVEVARKYWNSPRTCIDIDVLPELFPEIKEVEDEEIRKCLIAIITDFESLYLKENYSLSREDTIAWLEKQGEQKPEWSEEDEKCLANTVHILEGVASGAVGEFEKSTIICINWLKSLKERHTWKPSDEQMKILNEVLNFAANHESIHWNDYIFGILNNLIRQLKKLKEE